MRTNRASHYVGLGNCITPFVSKGDVLVWSDLVWELIECCPICFRSKLLDSFEEAIFPRSWSGSYLSILDARRPLIQKLASNEDKNVSVWAENMLIKFQQEHEYWERSESQIERKELEAFEW